MPSRQFYREINPTNAQMPLVFLEIVHSGLAETLRLVNDNQNWESNGNAYFGFSFDATLPEQSAGTIGRARLTVDNVGRELTQWIEASDGGRGAMVRVFVTARSTPNVVEQDYLNFALLSTTTPTSPPVVNFDIGYENPMEQPAVRRRFDPATAPGMFEG